MANYLCLSMTRSQAERTTNNKTFEYAFPDLATTPSIFDLEARCQAFRLFVKPKVGVCVFFSAHFSQLYSVRTSFEDDEVDIRLPYDPSCQENAASTAHVVFFKNSRTSPSQQAISSNRASTMADSGAVQGYIDPDFPNPMTESSATIIIYG